MLSIEDGKMQVNSTNSQKNPLKFDTHRLAINWDTIYNKENNTWRDLK